MFIPVTKIKKILDALLSLIKEDYEACSLQPSESFLYRVLKGSFLGDYDFYEQGVNIFTQSGNSSRQIQTRMGFDLGITTLPTIYVHQPNEVMKGVNTISFGMDTDEFYTNKDGTVVEKLFRGSSSTFEYVITSPNVLETILVYEVLWAALVSVVDTFMEYFVDVSITGKELVARHETMPEPLFIKTILVDVQYVKQVPRLTTPQQLITKIEFDKPTIYYDNKGIGSELL